MYPRNIVVKKVFPKAGRAYLRRYTGEVLFARVEICMLQFHFCWIQLLRTPNITEVIAFLFVLFICTVQPQRDGIRGWTGVDPTDVYSPYSFATVQTECLIAPERSATP